MAKTDKFEKFKKEFEWLSKYVEWHSDNDHEVTLSGNGTNASECMNLINEIHDLIVRVEMNDPSVYNKEMLDKTKTYYEE